MTLEELQAQLLELQDKYKSLEEIATTQKTVIEQSESKVKELQEHNQKLFLRVTTPVEEQKEEEYVSKLLGEEYTKVLDKKELEFIKEIEEEL